MKTTVDLSKLRAQAEKAGVLDQFNAIFGEGNLEVKEEHSNMYTKMIEDLVLLPNRYRS